MDPSFIQLMIPYYLEVAKLWHAGHVPLWNDLSGCGSPLLADVQAKALSPLHAVLMLKADMATYNLTILLELWIAAAGTFLFGRAIGLGRIAAVLPALSFVFCPFLGWFIELLGNGYMLYPPVFWLFTMAARRPTPGWACAAGVSVAALILSSHPEMSFLGTLFATLYTVLLFAFDAFESGLEPPQLRKLAVRQIGIAAVVAFCLSAPMLLPFVDYLRLADCYKFGTKTIEHIPFSVLALNMLQPTMGAASLYMGALTLLCLPVSFVIADTRLRKVLFSITITAAIGEAFTARMFPFNFLNFGPFAAVIANYAQPVTLLLIAVAAGIGMEQLVRAKVSAKSKAGKLLLMAAATVVVVPLLLRILHVPLTGLAFDTSLPPAHLDNRDWLRAVGVTLGICLLVFAKTKLKRSFGTAIVTLCIAISFIGETALARKGLALQPQFDYPSVDCIKELQKRDGRFIATGNHILKPNTNIVYGIKDLRFHNPMFPRRYRSFMGAAGAELDGFNQTFNPPLSDLISLANVKTVLSTEPVWSRHVADTAHMRDIYPAIEWDEIKLLGISVVYQPENKQAVGRLKWHVQATAKPLTYSIVLMDQFGTTIWFSDQKQLLGNAIHPGPPQQEIEFGVPLPLGTNLNQTWIVGVQIFDPQNLRFIEPKAGAVPINDHICKLFEFIPNKAAASALRKNTAAYSFISVKEDPNFSLVKEMPGSIRIYTLNAALPEAYIVHSVQAVPTAEQALFAITQPSFDPRREGIVESVGMTPPVLTNQTRITRESISITRSEPTLIKIETDSPQPGLLVLTDTFFPGWTATVDQKPAEILATNYLFRGVYLAQGSHKVVFKYAPISFTIGVNLAALCIAALILSFGYVLPRRKKRNQPR